MDFGLRGKVAVVTGASAGIGKAIALGLAAEGVALAICARREVPLREAEACDVGDASVLDEFLETAKWRFDHIDILVNNARAFVFTDDESGWNASLMSRCSSLRNVRAGPPEHAFVSMVGKPEASL